MPGAAFGMHRHTLKLSRASTSDHIFPSLYLTPFSVGQGHYHYPGTECGSCSPGGPHSHGAPQLFFLLLFLLFPLLLLPYNSARIKQPSVLLEGKPPWLRYKQIVNLSCVCAPGGKCVSKDSCTTSYLTKERLWGWGETSISVVSSISLPLLQDMKVENWHITRTTGPLVKWASHVALQPLELVCRRNVECLELQTKAALKSCKQSLVGHSGGRLEESGGPNYKVLEDSNDSNLNSARGHLCDILTKNPTSSCVLRRGVKRNTGVRVRCVLRPGSMKRTTHTSHSSHSETAKRGAERRKGAV